MSTITQLRAQEHRCARCGQRVVGAYCHAGHPSVGPDTSDAAALARFRTSLAASAHWREWDSPDLFMTAGAERVIAEGKLSVGDVFTAVQDVTTLKAKQRSFAHTNPEQFATLVVDRLALQALDVKAHRPVGPGPALFPLLLALGALNAGLDGRYPIVMAVVTPAALIGYIVLYVAWRTGRL
jgi:hypothetical protein